MLLHQPVFMRVPVPAGGGGGLDPVTALHWRVFLPGSNDSLFYLSEIEMRAAPGGADQCTGGTPSASNGDPLPAFDDGTATWSSGTGNRVNQWVAYRFASAVQVTEIALTVPGTGDQYSSPHVYLQHSDDGVTWTSWACWLGLAWAASETKLLNAANRSELLAGQAIYWRMNITANNGDGSFTDISEIELRGVSGGADRSSATAWFTTSTVSSQVNAWDGSAANVARLYSPPVPGWLGNVLPSAEEIVEVALTAYSAASRAPRDFSIDCSLDFGATWTTAWSVTGQTGWASGETRVFTRP